MEKIKDICNYINIYRYNYSDSGMVLLDESKIIPRESHAVIDKTENYLFIIHGYNADWSMAYSNMAHYFGPKGNGIKKYYYMPPEKNNRDWEKQEQPGGVFFLSYPTAQRNVDFAPQEIARAIDKRLDEFTKVGRFIRRKIDVIAHSQGGMIVEGTILLHNGRKYIDKFVALSSPLGGLPPEMFDLKILGIAVANTIFKFTHGQMNEEEGFKAGNEYFTALERVTKKVSTKILKIAGSNPDGYIATSIIRDAMDELYGGHNCYDGLVGIDTAHTFRGVYKNEDPKDIKRNCRVFKVDHNTILMDEEVLREINKFLR